MNNGDYSFLSCLNSQKSTGFLSKFGAFLLIFPNNIIQHAASVDIERRMITQSHPYQSTVP